MQLLMVRRTHKAAHKSSRISRSLIPVLFRSQVSSTDRPHGWIMASSGASYTQSGKFSLEKSLRASLSPWKN